jgi:hypothetical protein
MNSKTVINNKNQKINQSPLFQGRNKNGIKKKE